MRPASRTLPAGRAGQNAAHSATQSAVEPTGLLRCCQQQRSQQARRFTPHGGGKLLEPRLFEANLITHAVSSRRRTLTQQPTPPGASLLATGAPPQAAPRTRKASRHHRAVHADRPVSPMSAVCRRGSRHSAPRRRNLAASRTRRGASFIIQRVRSKVGRGSRRTRRTPWRNSWRSPDHRQAGTGTPPTRSRQAHASARPTAAARPAPS